MYHQSDKFKDKYRIPSNRLKGHDYGMNGCYYVTICTKNREHYFGEIVNEKLQLSETGKIAEQYWLDIPNHFPFVVLDEFVIMPNHIHGILFFDKPDNNAHCENAIFGNAHGGNAQGRDAINRVSTIVPQQIVPPPKKIGGITGVHNPMLHENLGRVIRWFKGRVSFECRKINIDFAWQTRFHDSIIRNDDALANVRGYILNNPANWNNDENNICVQYTAVETQLIASLQKNNS